MAQRRSGEGLQRLLLPAAANKQHVPGLQMRTREASGPLRQSMTQTNTELSDAGHAWLLSGTTRLQETFGVSGYTVQSCESSRSSTTFPSTLLLSACHRTTFSGVFKSRLLFAKYARQGIGTLYAGQKIAP